jgi:hypothetical protein
MLEQGYPAHARSSQGLNPSVALAIHHGTRGMCSMSSSFEHVQDSLIVQACAVVSIGVSDIGVVMMDNKKALFVMLVVHVF